jgi:hypothetical protein
VTAQPQWSPVDAETGDLLSLLADDGTLHTEDEWAIFLDCLRRAADGGGFIEPNILRPLVRDRIKPNRIGAFTNRAARSGLIAATGDWQVSDDAHGKNSGKPARIYRWLGAAP